MTRYHTRQPTERRRRRGSPTWRMISHRRDKVMDRASGPSTAIGSVGNHNSAERVWNRTASSRILRGTHRVATVLPQHSHPTRGSAAPPWLRMARRLARAPSQALQDMRRSATVGSVHPRKGTTAPGGSRRPGGEGGGGDGGGEGGGEGGGDGGGGDGGGGEGARTISSVIVAPTSRSETPTPPFTDANQMLCMSERDVE
jgi:hypothetical protein